LENLVLFSSPVSFRGGGGSFFGCVVLKTTIVGN